MGEARTQSGERRESGGFDEIVAAYSSSDEFAYQLGDGTRLVMTLQDALSICEPAMRDEAKTPEGRTRVERMFRAMSAGAQRLKEQHPDAYEKLRAAGKKFMAER